MNETDNLPTRGATVGKLARVADGAVTGIVLVCGLWLSLVAAWYTLSAFNFFYAAVYDLAGIGETIETYAPTHRYKRGFETTTREQRVVLFGQILEAVNHGAAGLETIVYFDREGRPIDTLLRKAEIRPPGSRVWSFARRWHCAGGRQKVSRNPATPRPPPWRAWRRWPRSSCCPARKHYSTNGIR
jgi:hypothetical protein